MRVRLILIIFSMAWLTASSFSAHAANIQIEEFKLQNGLEVVVIPNHRVPAVSHMLWFPSGGADDPAGKSGLAHYHEHLMFKGTNKFSAGEFESIVARLGGDHNAFTSYDTTGYYVNIPKDALPKIMELEADRIRGIVPSDEDAIKEREVILEERRGRVDNRPKALFNEQLYSALFVNHPYGTPLIGWMHEIESLTKQDTLDFHERYYQVNRATLVLAGDITAAEARPLVEKYYGRLDAGEAIQRNWQSEPPVRSTKRLTMSHERVNEPYFYRKYIMPSFGWGDSSKGIALMVFAEWFGSGDTSYLYQELVVKQKLATEVEAFYSPFNIGPAAFDITATPAKGVSLEKLEAAIDKALKKAMSDAPDVAEVERAKTLLMAETLYAREGLQGAAYIVGWTKMLGLETNFINEWGKLVAAVSGSSMVQAAEATIDINGSVTGYLLPKKNGSEAK